MSKYTKNDVLKFLYGEMSPAEQDGFLDALCTDEELFSAFEAMKKAADDLEPVEMAPSEGSVDRVMHFARSAARDRRRNPATRSPFSIHKNPKLSAFHQMVSLVMVICTFLTVGLATVVYRKAAEPENNWGMTETHDQFENVSLDNRLQFIRHQLDDIMDDSHEAVMPVHHNTYRLVNTDLFSTEPQPVIFLNIK
ncbi:MAG: hypothetical protein AAF998_15300 [Bacteroidota bacterium]